MNAPNLRLRCQHAPGRTPNFDRLARPYSWLEWMTFGPWLSWCRCWFLGEISSRRRALVLGDGDGRFTARLLAANPGITVSAVDASAAMLGLLVSRAGPHANRVHTRKTDVRFWSSPASNYDTNAGSPYDLVVSHFFLDCLTTEEIGALAVTLRGAVCAHAAWVVSEFAIPPGWFGKIVARPLVSALYRVFGWLTGLEVRRLPDHALALRRAGFSLQKHRGWLCGLLSSELWIAGAPQSKPAIPGPIEACAGPSPSVSPSPTVRV